MIEIKVIKAVLIIWTQSFDYGVDIHTTTQFDSVPACQAVQAFIKSKTKRVNTICVQYEDVERFKK